MSANRLKALSGVVPGAAVFGLLFLVAFPMGCAKKPPSRAESERKFLAPTDVSKLTPEARAHLPGAAKFQRTKP